VCVLVCVWGLPCHHARQLEVVNLRAFEHDGDWSAHILPQQVVQSCVWSGGRRGAGERHEAMHTPVIMAAQHVRRLRPYACAGVSIIVWQRFVLLQLMRASTGASKHTCFSLCGCVSLSTLGEPSQADATTAASAAICSARREQHRVWPSALCAAEADEPAATTSALVTRVAPAILRLRQTCAAVATAILLR
jgi:hypothetical protein